MIEINLIPQVKRDLLRARMLRNAVISVSFAVGIGAVVTVVVLGLVLGGQLALSSFTDTKISQKSEELLAVGDLNQTVTVQNQLSKLAQLHNGKRVNSRVLDVVTTTAPPAPNTIKLSSIQVDPNQRLIKIEGSAGNGYSALETYKKTLLNTKIETEVDGQKRNVPLTSQIINGDASFGENAEGKKVLQFSFSFSYPDELFATAGGAVSIITPTGRTDVTDSKVGVPQSLFERRSTDSNNTQQGAR